MKKSKGAWVIEREEVRRDNPVKEIFAGLILRAERIPGLMMAVEVAEDKGRGGGRKDKRGEGGGT